jgi:S1-C subfamily serine protease
VIFDPAGYAVTVSYVLLDAEIIRVTLRDGRNVPAKLVGLDLESGWASTSSKGWAVACRRTGDSSTWLWVKPATIGVEDDNDLVYPGAC